MLSLLPTSMFKTLIDTLFDKTQNLNAFFSIVLLLLFKSVHSIEVM